jgi:signal transduction histidine kinase
MMDFARVRPAAKSPVDINASLETALRLASFDKSFQKLQLKKSLTENLPPVLADTDQLQQVFLNLFLNARDAMPDGGEIFIKTVFKDSHIQIEIADNGTGIDEKNLKQVSTHFLQLNRPAKERV